MEQVSGHPGSLRLPVEPDAAGAVMNMIVPEHHVDRRVHRDAADLRAGQILPDVDPVNMVILDPGEDAAHVPDNAGLSAVMNLAAADDVMPDILLCPAVIQRLHHALPLRLRAVLPLRVQPLVLVLRLEIFAERDAAALRVRNLAVLNDPSSRPVRRDHPLLICCRRRPLAGRLRHSESGQRDISDPCLLRSEAGPSHIDLHLVPCRIRAKIRIDHCLIVLCILLRIPGAQRRLRLPGRTVNRRVKDSLEARHLVQCLIIKINFSQMRHHGIHKPVAANPDRIRIKAAEERVRNAGGVYLPLCRAVIRRPVRHRLSASDHRAARLRRTISYPRIRPPGMSRTHIFAVNPRLHQNLVPRKRDVRCLLDRPERPFFPAVPTHRCLTVHIINHSLSLPPCLLPIAETVPSRTSYAIHVHFAKVLLLKFLSYRSSSGYGTMARSAA